MCSFYNSTAQILSATNSISAFLKDADTYYAHTSKHQGRVPEKLAAHVELVQHYLKLSCELNGLDPVIDRLIKDIVEKNECGDDKKEIGNFIKKLFVNTIVYHDFGKVNENFQADKWKMNNHHFRIMDKHPLGTHHSALGAYLYITNHLSEIKRIFPGEVHPLLSSLVVSLSYNIFKHHSSRLADNMRQIINFTREEADTMKNYISRYQFDVEDDFSTSIPGLLDRIHKIRKPEADFSNYAFTKLNFSLLTAADYLATNEYMNGMQFKDATDTGLITDTLRKKIITNIQTRQPYNRDIYQSYSDTYSFINPIAQSNQNLNMLRKEMAIRLIQTVRKNTAKKLFYIEASTGAGKTNLSIIAIVELLMANPEINKVFYVSPYTALTTQTYQSITDTLGLSTAEVTQLHSKAGIQGKETQDEGAYGDNNRNFIDHLFVHYPFCLLTHIKFFDILKTNEKETNYLLHRLANSIVVIDELQSYSPGEWDKVIYFISNYAAFFNIRFILMSATLPRLGELEIFKNEHPDFVYLLGEDAKTNYFLNPNFRNRVAFNFDLIEDAVFNDLLYTDKLECLVDTVITKSTAYAALDGGSHKPAGSVYTVIEFIFKKSAARFYEIIQAKHDPFFEEIFVLSGTILEHRRKQIINQLKNKSNRSKRVLLITTQVVEAGVDIDMDLGFKNISLIDSDEQLAGRINRNINKPKCDLYLFRLDEAGKIYKNDPRYAFTKDQLNTGLYKEVLETKNFDKLYSEIFSKIDALNRSVMVQNFSGYRSALRHLSFQEVNDKFKLIDQDNLSIFVPVMVPVSVAGVDGLSGDPVFSDSELHFLAANKVDTANSINGEQVFDLYIRLIQNKTADFIKGKTDHKILQGIMSKFIFSVFNGKDTGTRFIEFSDVEKNKYGYIYLSGWNRDADNPLYHEWSGINESAFKDAHFI